RLMVEGRDEVFSVAELMKRHGIDYDNPTEGAPFIDDCEGYNGLCSVIPTAVKIYDRLGILIDAEFPLDNRWKSIRNLLRGEGLTLPDSLPKEGLLVKGLRPASTVGVWLMPNNSTAGMLENFLDTLIPA